jgi:hypothetical protein
MTQLHQLAGATLHPYYVMRIAGEPVGLLDDLGTGEADRLWNEALALRADIAAATPARVAYLETVIPSLDDKAASRAALNVKRAVFKGKAFPAEALVVLADWLDAGELTALAALNASMLRLAGMQGEILSAHDREMAHGSTAIGQLLNAQNMCNALSYTNPDLLRKLKRHFGEGAGKADAKATRNIEDSLLQYYARSSTKTSPLSSFTAIHVGKWQDGAGQADWASDYGRALDRRVELKAGLVRHIMAPFITNFAIAARAFPLKPNGSIRTEDGRIKLYSIAPGQEVSGRTWGTGLSVAQLDANAVINCVAHAFDANGGAPMMAETLCAAVCALAPKLTPQLVWPFLQKLYSVDYLVAVTGLVEQGDIIEWARALAANPAIPRGAEVLAIFDQLQRSLETMRGEDSDARATAVIAIREQIDALATLTGADKDGALFKTSFYENCYMADCRADLGHAHLERYAEELELLHELSYLLDPNQQLHARLCDFFVKQYGEKGVCTDIVSFLESFDKVYAPGVMDSEIDYAEAAPNSERTEAWLRAVKAFDTALDPMLHQDKDIALDLETMRGVLKLLPPSMRVRGSSYSYVVQTARENGEEQLVLNQVFGGRSSILSRFFEALDEESLDEIRDYVAAGAREGKSVEMGGVFGFNANRHPSMSARELDVAPFPPAFDGLEKLSLAELSLEYSKDDHRLKFRAPDGQLIDVWYHGLLIPSLLPQLQRILALSFTEGPSFAIVKSLVKLSKLRGQEVTHVPQISLGKVVLFRRTWLVSQAALPDPQQGAREFYLAAREWQQRLGLPERFFVRAVPLADNNPDGSTGAISWKDVNFKDMKPFYVDLCSPRFVRLMQNMMKRNSLTLCISELRPDFASHPVTVEGQPHVAELHFELTRFAQAQPVPVKDWSVVRVAYFDDDRSTLVNGPVREAIEMVRSRFGIERMFLAPHWKFGPHLDLVIECDLERFHVEVYPAVRDIFNQWLSANPSQVKLDPAAYAETSRRVGMFELDSGPYLPLLRNNSVNSVPYVRPRTLVLQQFAENKEQMLCDSLDLVMALYARKEADKDGFFLTLHAMLAAVADTYADGMREGYMSLRSHADYFFAAHDVGGSVRARFDLIDQQRGVELDQITRAVHSRDLTQLPLQPALREAIGDWLRIVGDSARRNREAVDQHYDELVGQSIHMDLARGMEPDAPAEFRERFTGRKISAIGEAFLNTERGRAAQRTPTFLAYRTNVNFFYSLLPILQVQPMQKFLLCHLISNSIERVFQQDWRAKIQPSVAEVE